MSLDRLAECARANGPSWDDERADRVLASAMLRRERRAASSRRVRRSMAVACAAALGVLVLLRAASAPAGANMSAGSIERLPEGALLAAQADPLEHSGDGGYGRD